MFSKRWLILPALPWNQSSVTLEPGKGTNQPFSRTPSLAVKKMSSNESPASLGVTSTVESGKKMNLSSIGQPQDRIGKSNSRKERAFFTSSHFCERRGFVPGGAAGGSPGPSVFVLFPQLPLQSVDDALDARLQYVLGYAYGSPSLLAVGKDAQHPHGGPGPSFLVVVGYLAVVEQAHVKLLQAHLGELGVVPFQDLAHGVVHRVDRAAAAGGHQLLGPEDLDQNGGLGGASQPFRGVEVYLIIDLAAQDPKRLQVILALADRHQLERSPSPIQAKENLLEYLLHKDT